MASTVRPAGTMQRLESGVSGGNDSHLSLQDWLVLRICLRDGTMPMERYVYASRVEAVSPEKAPLSVSTLQSSIKALILASYLQPRTNVYDITGTNEVKKWGQ